MKKQLIKLGYEVGTGEEVCIKLAHLVATGITAESGKTTTLQALIKRSGFKAIVFRTKIGERGITEGTVIPPYYKDDFDWEYASELLEASRKEKLKFERSWIIKYSKTANNLLEFKANIDKALADDISGVKKIRELEKSVLITLQAYLDKILPELQYAPLSSTLELNEGINIMDLERFKDDTQALIIKSVLTYVLKHEKNVIIVLPECWKYLPEGLGNPVKRPAEAFIRQGATNGNFLWLDSQDITGVEKQILKQVSNWCLGYQREVNEIKRTLDQIPLSKRSKPTPDEIATLKLGQFYVATSDFTKKVYVQPTWMDDETAKAIAMGRIQVEEVSSPSFTVLPTKESMGYQPRESTAYQAIKASPYFDEQKIRKELVDLRFDLIKKMDERLNSMRGEITAIRRIAEQASPNINEDAIISKLLLKMPAPTIDKEAIITEVMAKIPRTGGVTVYEIAPLDKLKKNFLEEAKQKILNDVSKVSDNAKRMLKYLETQGKGVKANEIIVKCYFMKPGGGATAKVAESILELGSAEVADKDTAGVYRTRLANRIKTLLEPYGATEAEIQQVHDHILYEILK
jgi:hypothetical protein